MRCRGKNNTNIFVGGFENSLCLKNIVTSNNTERILSWFERKSWFICPENHLLVIKFLQLILGHKKGLWTTRVSCNMEQERQNLKCCSANSACGVRKLQEAPSE